MVLTARNVSIIFFSSRRRHTTCSRDWSSDVCSSDLSFRGKRLIETLVDLPTVLPPSVAGVALLVAFGRRGILGGWLGDLGVDVAFSQLAVVMAQTFVAAPFFIRSAAVGFAAVDRELVQAAMLDGAGSWKLFREVILDR